MTFVTAAAQAGVTSPQPHRAPKLLTVVNVARWERIGRWFMSLWALFALPTVVQVARTGFGPVQVAVIAGFSLWGAIWIWFWLRALGHSRRSEIVAVIGATAILTVFALTAPAPVGVGGVLVFAFIMAGVSFPWREAVWWLVGLAALQVVLMAIRLEDATTATSNLLNSVLVGGIGVGARALWQSYRQLIAAREQLAHLAVTEERLRFARDLHDLLGQSLSVLVLKSELVAKQLPADAGDAVRREVQDISQVARKSLNDVREAVAGYRRPTVQAEISSARTALRAAGIGLLVKDTVGALPPEQDGVLAWCIREAVTNVVKHSGAKKCEVHLSRDNGFARLAVVDDGHGAPTFDGGNGLEGMRERVKLVGGTLDVASGESSGLRLQVTIPQPV